MENLELLICGLCFICLQSILMPSLQAVAQQNVCEWGAGDPRRGENAEHVMCWCQCHDISHIFVQIAGHQLSSQVSGPVRNCKQWTVSWEPGSWPSWPPHTDHEDWRNSSFCRKEVFWNKSEMKLNDMVREIGQLTFSVDITSYNNNHLQVSSSSPSDYHQQHRRRSCDFCLQSLDSGILDVCTVSILQSISLFVSKVTGAIISWSWESEPLFVQYPGCDSSDWLLLFPVLCVSAADVDSVSGDTVTVRSNDDRGWHQLLSSLNHWHLCSVISIVLRPESHQPSQQ